MSFTAEGMEIGLKYRIQYQIPEVHKKPREMVGVYLGLDDTRPVPRMAFSLRPEAGTSHLNQAWVKAVWITDQARKCYGDRIVRHSEIRVY